MNDNFTKYGVVGNIVVTLGILGVLLFGGHSAPGNYLQDAGSASGPSFGATAAGLPSVVFSHLTNLLVNQNLGAVQTFFLGADPTTGGNPIQTNASLSSSIPCNTASSTLFSVAPPSNATSTAQLTLMILGGNATTSSLLVGTSTKLTGLASTDVSPTLVTSTNGIPTSTIEYVASGIINGPGTNAQGFLTSGSGTATQIMVSPGQRVAAYSTSTATGLGAAGYVPGFTSCTYKIEWFN